jgi:copper chaperone NosL
MTKISKIVFLTASVVLILVYFFPIWSISLEAPQYPEGIGLYIWINKITGKNPHDLQNINGLNHYIGMKEIHPESIPELKIMPGVIGIMILLGITGAILKKKILLYLWLILFILFASAGMIDFYLWEYDYGHNLDPTAAIKIPGMSYQPPLIGSKQLLNMRTSSWPYIGGWIIVMSIGLGFVSIYLDKKSTKKRTNTS